MRLLTGNQSKKTLVFDQNTTITDANLTGANLITPGPGITVRIDPPCNPRFLVDGAVISDIGSKPSWLVINTHYHYGEPLKIKNHYAPALTIISKIIDKMGKDGLKLFALIVAGVKNNPAIGLAASIAALDNYLVTADIPHDAVRILTWLVKNFPGYDGNLSQGENWNAFKLWIDSKPAETWAGKKTELEDI